MYAALRQFSRLFREDGLPDATRPDDGTPFAAQALCGLSRLSVWWTQLGVEHQRIGPGQPLRIGAHERMHRTPKAETARPPDRDRSAQQARFDRWRAESNDERPHEALGLGTPAPNTGPRCAGCPTCSPEPEDPGYVELRYLSKDR